MSRDEKINNNYAVIRAHVEITGNVFWTSSLVLLSLARAWALCSSAGEHGILLPPSLTECSTHVPMSTDSGDMTS